jgi:hypothetical protein
MHGKRKKEVHAASSACCMQLVSLDESLVQHQHASSILYKEKPMAGVVI